MSTHTAPAADARRAEVERWLHAIVSAGFAVPVAATIAVVFRYHQEMASLRAGEISTDDIKIATSQCHEDIKELYENLEASSAR